MHGAVLIGFLFCGCGRLAWSGTNPVTRHGKTPVANSEPSLVQALVNF